jgi:hypothetical protein
MAAALRAVRREPAPPVRSTGLRLALDADTSLGHAQRQLLSFNLVLEQMRDLRATRAYRYGIRVRSILRGLAAPARRLRARMRRS